MTKPALKPYQPKHHVRIVTAASLFDGHDAAINIMRRILQSSGAEVIHLGHNRSVQEIVDCAIQEDVQGIAITSYQGGHVEYFKYMHDQLKEAGADIRLFGGGGGTILPTEIAELHEHGIDRIYSPDDGRVLGLQGMINDLLQRCDFEPKAASLKGGLAALTERDPQLMAQLVTLAENHAEQRDELGRALKELGADAAVPVLGITGTGGSGKSSLVDELVRRFLLDFTDKTIAVVSVDPSKRKTGGALLGDRIRMRSVGADPGVFIRSMAARDQLGGVAAGVRAAIAILGASFDCILVETVGVGQSESEVASLVDSLLFVANPGSGDALQFMKAGLLEWPDVFVVNKADLGPPATRTASELESALSLAPHDSAGWQPPVLMVSARDGSGIDALADALDAHRRHLIDSDDLRARRAAGRDAHGVESRARRYGSHGLEQLGGARAVAERVREDAAHSTFAWVDVLGREIEDALRKPA